MTDRRTDRRTPPRWEGPAAYCSVVKTRIYAFWGVGKTVFAEIPSFSYRFDGNRSAVVLLYFVATVVIDISKYRAVNLYLLYV